MQVLAWADIYEAVIKIKLGNLTGANVTIFNLYHKQKKLILSPL